MRDMKALLNRTLESLKFGENLFLEKMNDNTTVEEHLAFSLLCASIMEIEYALEMGEFEKKPDPTAESVRLETLKDVFYLTASYSKSEIQDKLAIAIQDMEKDGVNERKPLAYLKVWKDPKSGGERRTVSFYEDNMETDYMVDMRTIPLVGKV